MSMRCVWIDHKSAKSLYFIFLWTVEHAHTKIPIWLQVCQYWYNLACWLNLLYKETKIFVRRLSTALEFINRTPWSAIDFEVSNNGITKMKNDKSHKNRWNQPFHLFSFIRKLCILYRCVLTLSSQQHGQKQVFFSTKQERKWKLEKNETKNNKLSVRADYSFHSIRYGI